MLSRLRTLVKEADPEVVEEWKWRGVPVWSHDGLICTGETYKNVVKMTFAKGAALKDPSGLFNSSLDGNTRRAIDLHEGDEIDEEALKSLVRAALTLNKSTAQSYSTELTGGRPVRRSRRKGSDCGAGCYEVWTQLRAYGLELPPSDRTGGELVRPDEVSR